MLLSAACVEKTIRVGDPVVPPRPTPALAVDTGIRLDEFKQLCNFLPDEGDRFIEDGNRFEVTLGTTKRRQNPQAMRIGCTPGMTFVFSGPELRLEAPGRSADPVS